MKASQDRESRSGVNQKQDMETQSKPRTPAQSLCCDCGLCCDGSVFEDVELTGGRESTRLEILGLEGDEEDGRELLLHPCRALKGAVCQIYRHRPEVCRTFECQVLKDFNAGMETRESALKLIQEVRSLYAAGESDKARQIVARRFLGFTD